MADKSSKIGWVRISAGQVSGAIETPTCDAAFEAHLRPGTNLTVYDLRCGERKGAIWQWRRGSDETEGFSFVLEQGGESLFGRLILETVSEDERLFRIEAHPPPG